jgi:hypothetical protein
MVMQSLALGGGASITEDVDDTNLYGYIGENPVVGVDPFGLWQFSISGGLVFGGQFTFGENHGQFNIGGYIGAAEGASVSFDPNDSGCQSSGFHGGIKGEGQVGLGAGLEGSGTLGVNPADSNASLSSGVPGTPLGVSVGENGGQLSAGTAIGVGGESAFVGVGGVVAGSRCGCN